MTPLVTVVIPNYNNGKYLPECIESISKQTYKNIEILVIDDCSTDNSVLVLKKLSLTHPNLVFYVNNENKGVSFSRNRGVEMAKGDYITTLDPDDIYYPDKVEREINLVLSKKNMNIVAYSGFTSVDNELNEIPFKTKLTNFNAINGWVFKKILYMVSPIPRDMLFTKDQFYHVGGFDESMSLYEDWDFKLRLSKEYMFFYSGSKGVKYRRHHDGLSSVVFSKHMTVMNSIFLKYSNSQSLFFFHVINGSGFGSKILKSILYIPIFSSLFSDKRCK